ncbi:MAG TPA: DUF6569 family protein [Gemmataceae bacterium]|nr:DUF6569 family protein [Gemmataceae bacterium]
MRRPLPDMLHAVYVTAPQQVGPLQVFGVRSEGEGCLDYITLDDALAAGTLEVTEVSEGGSVPTLRVSNRAGRMVFLMAGEQLVGARQNRVLNASLMMPAHGELPIPVSCVEAGRWSYRSRRFAGSGTSAHSLLRRQMTRQVTASYRATGTPTSEQAAVWNEVSRKLGRMGSRSPSAALYQAYEDHRDRLADMLRQLAVPQACCGAAFALGGRIAGLDLFDRPSTLAKLWPKLVGAYAIDALEGPGSAEAPVTPEAVCAWLRSAAAAKTESFASPGLGEDVRLEGAGVVGAGLVVEGQPVHVELFAESGVG